MITSNYSNISSNQTSPTRAAGATLENQQTSEGAPQEAKQAELNSYASAAGQDVQDLKNASGTSEEPSFYQLTFSIGDGVKAYPIQAQVIKMSDQNSYPPMAGEQKSRLYQTVVVSEELAKDFPDLVGRPLVMDIAKGVDSRMGVQMGLQTLLTDARTNQGTIGAEPRTGAQITNGPEGVQAHPVGGKDGIELPHIKMPGGGFDLN